MTLREHLSSLAPPHVELLVLPNGPSPDQIFPVPAGFLKKVIQGKKCTTKSRLLGEWARVLEFPSYVGKNWDAFEECVTDLYWLPAPGYLFIVLDAEEVLKDAEGDYQAFIKILQEAGRRWATEQDVRPEIPFHVVFTVSEQHKARRANWYMPMMTIEKPGVKPRSKDMQSPKAGPGRH